jgi:hypothetical protein
MAAVAVPWKLSLTMMEWWLRGLRRDRQKKKVSEKSNKLFDRRVNMQELH